MDKFILVVMVLFFLIGGVDCILGNKFGFGEKFKEGIESIGVLVLSMTGIFAISPIIANLINSIFKPVGEFFNIDISIFSSIFLAIDMGALGISESLAISEEMMVISGIVIASTLGATLSFSIPLAFGMINKKYNKDLAKGMIYGVATMPIAPIIAGIILKVNLKLLFVNLVPLFIITIFLILGILKFESIVEKIFEILSKGILIVSLGALVLLGINSILGIEVIKGMLPIDEALGVAGRIGIFLAGAYPFLEFVTRYFSKYLTRLAGVLKIKEFAIINLFAGLVSNIIIFKNFDKLGTRGRIICSAFSVSGAFVLGGQLGFVSAKAPNFINVYIISKCVAGIVAISLSLYILNKKNRVIKV
ncbi:MAG: ethanolamine utilization protein EutH [Sarcina sp.]